MSSAIDLENTYGAHNYHPLPVVLTRGEGVYVWDEDGKKYLDMMSAYSAVSHGHANPRLVAVVKDQVEKLTIVSRAFYTEKLGRFLQRACELTRQELDFRDPGQPLLICARIVRPSTWQTEKPIYKSAVWQPNQRPAYSSAETGHYGDVYQ